MDDISYIDLIEIFNTLCFKVPINIKSQIIFFKLLHLINKSNEEEWVEISNDKLMVLSTIRNMEDFVKCRETLIKLNLIEYIPCDKPSFGKYKIKKETFKSISPKNKEQKSSLEKIIQKKNQQDILIKDMFDKFWEKYPKKQGKKIAFSRFKNIKNINPSLLEEILKSIDRFNKSPQWQTNNGAYIPLPSSFISGERWKDEWLVENTYSDLNTSTDINDWI